jgi:hypothetical protein
MTIKLLFMTITLTTSDKDFDLDYVRYTEELERKWQKSLPRINETELLVEIPNGKQLIQNKISEWQQKRYEIKQNIRTKLISIRDLSNQLAKDFFRLWLQANEGEQLINADRHIARLKFLLSTFGNKSNRVKDFELAKQQALDTPIETIAEPHTRLRKVGNKLAGLCPLHEDKRPSFYIYPDTNTFHCFGCQANGDVITLVQLLNNLSFKEALNLLAN